jgi:hypothetical protein
MAKSSKSGENSSGGETRSRRPARRKDTKPIEVPASAQDMAVAGGTTGAVEPAAAARQPLAAPSAAERALADRNRALEFASMPRRGAGAVPGAEEIARRAYALFVARGGAHGMDLDDWLQAERELRTGAHSLR